MRLAFHAGLPPVTPHGARHGAATAALAGGADITAVSRMLRHASIQETADFYAEVLSELAQETAKRVEAIIPRSEAGSRSHNRHTTA